MPDHSPAFLRPVLARHARLATIAEAMNYLRELGADVWTDEDYQATLDCLVTALDTREPAAVVRANTRLVHFLSTQETFAR